MTCGDDDCREHGATQGGRLQWRVLLLSLAGSAFGKVLQDAGKGPWAANQTVTVTFQSACPRNSLGRRGSFLTVERLADGSKTGWDVVRPLLHRLM